ncbi:MAG: hypothetical protein VX346_11125 [Planctomycetota bacterium]|nr:hypothetical protein [Planctomycetota bacterium]
MTALFLTEDLMFTSRVSAQASALHIPIETIGSLTQLDESLACQPTLFVVDLAAVATDQLEATVAMVRNRAPGATIIAFGPHVWEAKLQAAQQAGCDQVLSRGQLHKEMTELLQQYVPG